MMNFVALGKVQVCILCIFCILRANFLFAATYIDPVLNIPEYLSETQEDGVQSVDGHCTCGDGKSDPVDTNKLWKDNCFAVDGKSYQAGQYLTSCSGCLKFICRLKVQNEKDPDCEKYGWEKLLEDTCCQDCNGKVFPAGSVMKEQKLTDKCATTVTTKCAFIRGGTTATIWESSSYEKCCINSEGVQLLNTTKLVPKLCSVRICASQSGKHEPSYALIKTAHGCNCCQDGSKLYADGTWKIIQGKNATCCEGRWVVEFLHPSIDPATSVDSGTWGESEFCPPGSYASAYELKIAPMCTRRCSSDDDIGLMGVRLHCTYPGGIDVIATVTSSVTGNDALVSRHRDRSDGRSLWPYWTPVKTCPNDQFLKSARYLSEPFPNVQIADIVDDPSGGHNLDMNCADGTNLLGEGVQTDGSVWLDWESCPDHMAVCGIRSRLYDGETDYLHNLGHTQIRLYCCKLSMY